LPAGQAVPNIPAGTPADPEWLNGFITRRVPLDRRTEALDRQPEDIKVVVDLTA
jgi:hypothetical protein